MAFLFNVILTIIVFWVYHLLTKKPGQKFW
jgi:hypothetical protein